MNIWLIRLIFLSLSTILIVLIIAKCPECPETDNLILKWVSGVFLIVVIVMWVNAEIERK